MLDFVHTSFAVLDLTAMFIEKNKEFTRAVKERRPSSELAVLHSELQEIYNHIISLRQRQVA